MSCVIVTDRYCRTASPYTRTQLARMTASGKCYMYQYIYVYVVVGFMTSRSEWNGNIYKTFGRVCSCDFLHVRTYMYLES